MKHKYNKNKYTNKNNVSDKEKNIIKNFTNIMSPLQHYNEFKITNKIHYNKFKYTRVIPKGKKIYVWFQSQNKIDDYAIKYNIQYFEKKNDSYSLLNDSFNICCDYNSLACGRNGTVLYGTLFMYDNVKYFNIENIFYYKNKNITRENWENKYKCIEQMFLNHIKQVGYNSCDIILLNCLTYNIPKDILTIKDLVPYNIYCFQYLFNNSDKVYFKLETNNDYNDNNSQSNKKYMNMGIDTKKRMMFNIKACLNHDEYDLFKGSNYIGKVYVPNFKTSVFLNSKFRNIRENHNLDLLEESDDDEDFENIYLDKYVDLNKMYSMYFQYDNLTQLWKPIIK